MPDKRLTVAEAATTCLAFCKDAPDPQAIVAKFMDRLSNDPQWSTEELIELARLIAERMPESLDTASRQPNFDQ